jgi:hypothetical protein
MNHQKRTTQSDVSLFTGHQLQAVLAAEIAKCLTTNKSFRHGTRQKLFEEVKLLSNPTRALLNPRKNSLQRPVCRSLDLHSHIGLNRYLKTIVISAHEDERYTLSSEFDCVLGIIGSHGLRTLATSTHSSTIWSMTSKPKFKPERTLRSNK